MTDRELLELAAKAAGIRLFWNGGNSFFRAEMEYPHDNWNPLKNDGDALRLAVKLDLLSGAEFWRERSVQLAIDAFSGDRQDPYAATRRAITKAAAELGNNL